jgi:uncharacterized protein (TIGR01777 family)
MQKRILILGGTGFIGQALGQELCRQGFLVSILSRHRDSLPLAFPCQQLFWDGLSITADDLKGVHAVVNLCGEPIFNARWSSAFIKKLYDSRLLPTRALAQALAAFDHHVECVINASAIGYFGLDSQREADEYASPGTDFLAKLCQAWEEEAHKIAAQSRLVIPRFGVVYGLFGGAFPLLSDIYAASLGARLGSGQQFMNWVHVFDVVRFIIFAIEKQEIKGSYNLVAPGNIRQANFHQQMAAQSHSFSFMRVAAILLRILLGQQSSALVQGARVSSVRLEAEGFSFSYPDFKQALLNFAQGRKFPRAYYLCRALFLPCTPDELSVYLKRFSQKHNKLLFKKFCHSFIIYRLNNGVVLENHIEYELNFRPLSIIYFRHIKKRLELTIHAQAAELTKSFKS